MTVADSTVPDKFQGLASDKKENWANPKLISFDRKKINDYDVVLKNKTCGLCYSDIHTLQGNWTDYKTNELVVGHEICGIVIAVGSKVTEFKVGDRAGIGAASSSCRECSRCHNDTEQYCKNKSPLTMMLILKLMDTSPKVVTPLIPLLMKCLSLKSQMIYLLNMPVHLCVPV